MGNKVLVAYASKYGATAEIAEKIGQVINRAFRETRSLRWIVMAGLGE